MDPLQPKEIEDNIKQQHLLIVTNTAGEVRIQLEGSHTSSTKTETRFATTKRNVKFEDDINKREIIEKTANKNVKENELQKLKNCPLGKEKNEFKVLRKATEEEKAVKCYTIETPEIVTVRGFDTQNESLEFFNKTPALCNRSLNRQELSKSLSDITDSLSIETIDENPKLNTATKENLMKGAEAFEGNHYSGCAEQYFMTTDFKEAAIQGEEILTKTCYSISTATNSCEVKSFGCQTQITDCLSLNEVSFMESSSLTSRYEQTNSLNNYAQADSACLPFHESQQGMLITKHLVTETAIIQQPTNVPESNFNVITIEADSRPSSADLRRAPFCQRFCEVVGDFCAATFLCLQVNRDCIFCLGFFAAFVVSASFLTAFFYHTLIINPSLWQIEQNF